MQWHCEVYSLGMICKFRSPPNCIIPFGFVVCNDVCSLARILSISMSLKNVLHVFCINWSGQSCQQGYRLICRNNWKKKHCAILSLVNKIKIERYIQWITKFTTANIWYVLLHVIVESVHVVYSLRSVPWYAPQEDSTVENISIDS